MLSYAYFLGGTAAVFLFFIIIYVYMPHICGKLNIQNYDKQH